MSHLGYFDPETDGTPLPQFVEAGEAKRKAHRAFFRGAIFGVAVASWAIIAADIALSETISIGGIYINGSQQTGTTVTIEPSDNPGELATVTLVNRHVNDGGDTGTYTLAMGDVVTVGIIYEWDANPLTGADAITVIPPAGITCVPADCRVTVMEGFTGAVVLLDWVTG